MGEFSSVPQYILPLRYFCFTFASRPERLEYHFFSAAMDSGIIISLEFIWYSRQWSPSSLLQIWNIFIFDPTPSAIVSLFLLLGFHAIYGEVYEPGHSSGEQGYFPGKSEGLYLIFTRKLLHVRQGVMFVLKRQSYRTIRAVVVLKGQSYCTLWGLPSYSSVLVIVHQGLLSYSSG